MRKFTPPGWPKELSLGLPASGDLKVAGVKDVKREDIHDDDFMWYNPFNRAGEGAPYSIDGVIRSGGVSSPTDSDWEEFAEMYKSTFKASVVTIVSSDNNVRYGGRRWVRFDLTGKDPNDHDHNYVAFGTILGGKIIYVDVFYDSPPKADLEDRIAVILGGK